MIKANDNVNITDLSKELLCRIQLLEDVLGYQLIITSGYRAPEHPLEARKPNGPGVHSEGIAVDVAVIGGTAVLEFVKAAVSTYVGFERIGISRKKNFIHLDVSKTRPKSIWVY